MRVVHLELADANRLVAELHRHHSPVRGHRFSLGVRANDGELVGAAIVGRPVARAVDSARVVEVTRLVTDGTKNACSTLYAAAARAARELGYQRIQTYILAAESGVSLRASGWRLDGWTDSGGGGARADRPPADLIAGPKQRWVRDL